MATNYLGAPVVDPDFLTYTKTTNLATAFAAETVNPLIIDYTNKRIALKVIDGTMSEDGATIKAVYSKLKEAWKDDADLIKFPFPMGPITDEQFEMVNGWNWDKTETSGDASATTVQLLRTGGWSVVNTSGNITERWAGIISLGTLVDVTDQIYYQQVGPNEASVDFVLTGPVNQAVQIIDDPNGDGTYSDGYDKRTYFKVFVREQGKTYSDADLADIGVTSMDYQAYRFPLTNATDLNIEESDANIAANEPYTKITITYLRDSNGDVYNIVGPWVSGTTYAIGDVVSYSGRWYKRVVAGAGTDNPTVDTTNYDPYEGERQIGATYYAFNIIIDGDTDVSGSTSGDALIQEIYEKIQYQLRQAADIDAGSGSVTGKTADSLLTFVGPTLITASGVYIDNFNVNDTNSITFNTFEPTAGAATAIQFPFVASLTINFGTNLVNDASAKYWVFFQNDDAGDNTGRDFGTANAIIVQDNDGVNMANNISGNTSFSRSYNYDGNVQRGASSANTAAPVTVVGIGLSTGQYVQANTTILRTTTNSVTLTAALERNYANPA